VTTQPAAGDTHDDPLVTPAAEWLCDQGPHEYDDGLYRLPCSRHLAEAGDLIAALRPHIDAEKQAAARDTLLHQPVIAPCTDGTFGVYCSACSHEAQEYVYPCTARSEWDYPAILTAAGGGHPPTDPAGDTPRCQHVSPSPWGPTQCALPADHDGRHAYSPSESISDIANPAGSFPHGWRWAGSAGIDPEQHEEALRRARDIANPAGDT